MRALVKAFAHAALFAVCLMWFAPGTALAAPGPDLKVDKSCQLDPAHGPTAVSCVINVTNIGSVPSASPVSLVDTSTAPAGTSFTSASGTFGCTTAPGSLPLTIHCGAPISLTTGNSPGASGSTFLKFTLPPEGGWFKNCVTVSQGQNAATLPDPDLTNNSVCTSINVPGTPNPPPNPPAPDLRVDKSCQLDPAHGPTAISCVVNVVNIGGAASTSPVTLVDNPGGPAGTTFTSASGTFGCTTPTGPLPQAIHCGAPISLATGNAPGASGSTFFTFNLPPQGGAFKNCVQVSQGQAPGTPPESSLTNNSACTSITVPPASVPVPDIKVDKACKYHVQGGLPQMMCQITVVNLGPGPTTTPVTVTDNPTAPAGTTYGGSTGSISCSTPAGPLPAAIQCSIPAPLAANQPKVAVLRFTLPPAGGLFRNCVNGTQGQTPGSPPEADMANNSKCVSVNVPPTQQAPDLAVKKSCVKDPKAGLVCTIVITNTSTTTASGAPITLTDTITSGGTVLFTASNISSCPATGLPYTQPIVCTLPSSIAAGQVTTVLHSFRPVVVTIPGKPKRSIKNCVAVSQGGSLPEANMTNNTACFSINWP